MAGGSQRGTGASRKAGASAEGQHDRAGRPVRGPEERAQLTDRRLVAVVSAAIVALLTWARYSLDPTGPLGWTFTLLVLCTLIAAVAARALLGRQAADEAEERQPPRRVLLALWLLLVAAALLPNLRTLTVGFLADDFGLLRAAGLASGPLQVFERLPLRIFYRPVSLLVWWLGLHLWGGAALGYHVFSLLLHAANTLLLYLLARSYTKSIFGGAAAALLFALHPVHIEATAWPSAQPDLLCTGFALLSMWCLEHFLRAGAPRRHLALAAALPAFLLALLSKETAAVLPAVVFLRLLLASGGRRWARLTGVTLAYVLATVAYLALRSAMLGERWLGGYGVGLTLWDAVSSPTPLLLLGQLLFPVHVTLVKPVLFPYLWLTALLLLAVGLLWLIRSLVFVSWQRLALYAGYLFVPMIPITTAGLTIGEEMANSRYAYLPSVGLALLFGEICARRRRVGRRPRLAPCAAVLCVVAVLSCWYVEPWRGAARLRDHLLAEGARIVADLPESPPPTTVYFTGLPFAHLGAALFVQGCYSAALAPHLAGRVTLEDVAPTPAESAVMDATDLLPGEYVVSWQADTHLLAITRAGGGTAPPAGSEARP